MTRGFRLGRVGGIEIVADSSLLLLALLLVGSLYVDLRRVSPGSTPESLLVAGALGGGLFIASVLAHELSHSLLAQRRGLPVRRIRLFIFGGLSEIEREAENPGDEFQIAVAGPAASALIGLGLIGVGAVVPAGWVIAQRLGSVLGIVNLVLAAFNLLPGFPLDGGRALRALLWRRWERQRATRIAIAAGRTMALVIVGLGVWLLVSRRDLGGLWTIGVGWFLHQAAVGAAARERLLATIEGLTVGDVMRAVTETIPAEASIAELVALHQVGPVLRAVPVVVDGRVRGVVGESDISAVAPGDRALVTVGEVMTGIGPRDVVPAEESIEDFLGRPAAPARTVLATASGRVVGIVTARELAFVFDE